MILELCQDRNIQSGRLPGSRSGRCLLTFGTGCQPADATVSHTTQHFPHWGTQPSLRLLHIPSSDQSCSQVTPWGEGAADRQATGTWDTNSSACNRDVWPRMSSVTPSGAWSRQKRSCCCTLIVYLKCVREKCSGKFAEIWTEIQTEWV